MFDDLAAQFFEHLHVSVSRYLEVSVSRNYGKSQDIKAVVDACSALYHFREHLPSKLRLSRRKAVESCGDYALIGDVTSASKHGKLDRGDPLITVATQIEECIVITDYEDEIGPYRDATKELVVRLNDGT